MDERTANGSYGRFAPHPRRAMALMENENWVRGIGLSHGRSGLGSRRHAQQSIEGVSKLTQPPSPEPTRKPGTWDDGGDDGAGERGEVVRRLKQYGRA
jgi:hypothetical protein